MFVMQFNVITKNGCNQAKNCHSIFIDEAFGKIRQGFEYRLKEYGNSLL